MKRAARNERTAPREKKRRRERRQVRSAEKTGSATEPTISVPNLLGSEAIGPSARDEGEVGTLLDEDAAGETSPSDVESDAEELGDEQDWFLVQRPDDLPPRAETAVAAELSHRAHFEHLGTVYATYDIDVRPCGGADTTTTRSPQRLLPRAVHRRLSERWEELGRRVTPLQRVMIPLLCQYRDLLWGRLTSANADEVHCACALHVLNHIFRSRKIVLRNNAKLHRLAEEGEIADAECRDQGFVRPRVLMLFPYRNSAAAFLRVLLDLTPAAHARQIQNRQKFFDEYVASEERVYAVEKPDDFVYAFRGNVNDCFRMGIRFTRSAVHLYSDFYESDLIVASPLGLRMVLGDGSRSDPKGAKRADFLSSIELCVVNCADMLLMQNWEHTLSIFASLNLIPKDASRTDFARVRRCILSGRAKECRQTIILSEFVTPELNAILSRHCFNFRGRARVRELLAEPSIEMVQHLQLKQIFHRVNCETPSELPDAKFEYLVKMIIPVLKLSSLKVLIYIPSYFDFVRIRNYFRRQEIECAVLNEYSSAADVSRHRSWFFHGEHRLLLYTERFHFFHRFVVRGAQALVFYGIPSYARFYAEITNAMQVHSDSNVLALYSPFELLELERLVGRERAREMFRSRKTTYLFL